MKRFSALMIVACGCLLSIVVLQFNGFNPADEVSFHRNYRGFELGQKLSRQLPFNSYQFLSVRNNSIYLATLTALRLITKIDQKGCEYQPYILAVQTGQKILVKNSDPVLHNIHPTPAAPGNKEENRAQMPNGPDLPFSFPSPETFLRIKCDVHPWMFAYVCVVDSPYIGVTDKDGKYTIKNVPDGKYTMEFYHRKAAPLSAPVTAEVEVKGGAVTKDIALEAK